MPPNRGGVGWRLIACVGRALASFTSSPPAPAGRGCPRKEGVLEREIDGGEEGGYVSERMATGTPTNGHGGSESDAFCAGR